MGETGRLIQGDTSFDFGSKVCFLAANIAHALARNDIGADHPREAGTSFSR